MQDHDLSTSLQEQVAEAAASQRALHIQGGGSKAFYGRDVAGGVLNGAEHRGIISYEPTELVITARAGTPLQLIEQTLAGQGQMLGFEPPHFGARATLGGTVACNFSGPRRAAAGSARDFVLGSKLVNGNGELLTFGGQVMKNVAGYDVSRLMCGALGTLGVLLEVSLKVLPRPELELTLSQEMDATQALARLHALGRQALPISASVFDGLNLHIRLSGSSAAVTAARSLIGGEEMQHDAQFWQELREQQLAFFKTSLPLWRLSLASNTPPLNLPGKWLYEWDGAQRWLFSEAPAEMIRTAVAAHGGHATCFRAQHKPEAVFHPLDAGRLKLHQRLKQAFDPHGILNPGRMYREI
ncbi:MAG TPA: glycolate oxidase subunit GlcE [Gallionellaceae bacterium]